MTTVRAEPVAVSAIGTHHDRVDGPEKVSGRARYAAEHADASAPPLAVWMVTSTIARGRVLRVEDTAALAHPGVVRVLDHTTAPRLADTSDAELAVLQDAEIRYRGQIVALVVAETAEAAREGARLVQVHHEQDAHEAAFDADSATYAPEGVNAGHETDYTDGDVEAAVAGASVVVEGTYSTPNEFNSPLEPHAAVASWDGSTLTMHDSTQAVHPVAATLAPMLGLGTEQVRVVAPYVGGGFGSKGMPHAPEMAAALAAIALGAQHDGRAVRLVTTRQQMFALTGFRSAGRSSFRLAAEDDGTLRSIEQHAVAPTARVKEFLEQTATASRMMYAAPARRTTHRGVALDVPVSSWMRAPGEMPGMFAHEVAMDELAVACGVDPILLRERNEPRTDPETGKPWNDRRLLECLTRGAQRFGWDRRPSAPRSTRDGDWWVGTGVASATYPMLYMPGTRARIEALEGGRYAVSVGAVDIGTGARTVLHQIAADALGVPTSAIDLAIGDTDLPFATVAGGSAGTSSWGTAVVAAAQQLHADHGTQPAVGVAVTAGAEDYPDTAGHALHSFGATFAEVRVHAWTGEVRVPRLLGVYSVGRVINPTTALSQFRGGLVMGMSAALHEDGYRDARSGHVVTQDLATYHVAAHADIGQVDAEWLEEHDELSTPMGSRGVGEIGIVGTAASIANAAFHATGVRVRDLPLTLDHFLDLPPLD